MQTDCARRSLFRIASDSCLSLRTSPSPAGSLAYWSTLVYNATATLLDGHTLSSLPFAVASRDEPRRQHPRLSRGIESIMMASIAGPESPQSRTDSTTPSTVSAKRKRDDSLDTHNHVNGAHESKSEDTAQDSQSLIQDLVDVLNT